MYQNGDFMSMNKIFTKYNAKSFIIMNLAVILTTTGTHFFKFPNNFSTGGVTGISIVLVKYFPWMSNAMIVSAFNVVFIALGIIFLGKAFGFRTFYVTVMQTVMLQVAEVLFPMSGPMTTQPLLELFFAVILPAVGSALLFNIGSSTGGTDIITMIIKNKTHLNTGRAMLSVDFAIVLLAFVAFGPTVGLFSIFGLVLRAIAVDFILEGMNTYKSFTIVTEKPQDICDFITTKLGRSATVYNATGLFEHKDKTIILTVMNKQEGHRLQKVIKNTDEAAFVLITNTTEIIGRGFRGGI